LAEKTAKYETGQKLLQLISFKSDRLLSITRPLSSYTQPSAMAGIAMQLAHARLRSHKGQGWTMAYKCLS
jgi:hypothetical protein